MAPLLLGVLRLLPTLIQAGIDIVPLVTATNTKTIPTNAVEVFASQTLKVLPGMIQAGYDVTEIVTRTNDQVGLMLREARAPRDDEWADQAARIVSLEKRADAAGV